MSKKKSDKLSLDEILEQAEKEATSQKKEQSDISKQISKIEAKEIIKDISEAVKSGEIAFTKVKVYAVKNGEEYFINEFKYEKEVVLDPEGWLKKRVIDNIPPEYKTDTFVIKAIMPDGRIGFETTVKVAIPKSDSVDEAFSKKVKELLELSSMQTQSLLETMKHIQSKNGDGEVVRELIKLLEDMIIQLREEKEKVIEEIKKREESEGKKDREILQEIIAIEKMFDEKIEKLLMIVNSLESKKESEESKIIAQLLPKLLEKIDKKDDPIEMMNKMLDALTKITRGEKEEDKFRERLFDIMLEKLMKDEKQDPVEELEKQLKLITTLKEAFGIGEDSDDKDVLITMVMQKIEEMEKKQHELIMKLIEKDKEKKDEFQSFIDMYRKIKEFKKLYEDITGSRPQPVKSFIELVAEVLNSPVIENVARILADALVKQELIRQGLMIQGDNVVPLPVQRQLPPTPQGFGYPQVPPNQFYQPHQQLIQQQFMPQQVQQYPVQQPPVSKVNINASQVQAQNQQEQQSCESGNEKEIEWAINTIKKSLKSVISEMKKTIKKYERKKNHDEFVNLFVEKVMQALLSDRDNIIAIQIMAKYKQSDKLKEIIRTTLKEEYNISEKDMKDVEKDIEDRLNKMK